ncbi:MAG: winged helix-turn-helix domain-containing protein [bacterium]|nr:winged helix-turn-helix domain-containing protein [bacterium]
MLIKQDEVNIAFEILIEIFKENIKSLNEYMSLNIENKNHLQLENINEKIGKLIEFIKKIEEIQQEYNKLFFQNGLIENKNINENVNEYLLLKKEKENRITPKNEYIIPILEVLLELGGKAKVRKILEKVYLKVKDKLTSRDLDELESNGEPRWRNNAKWARNDMVIQGLLNKNSPYGIWEITEKGINYLQKSKMKNNEIL